jgi:hypothetical protein
LLTQFILESMAVASKSPVSTRKRRDSSKARAGQTVPIVLRSQSPPFWLRQLCVLQRYSSIATFILVAVTLMLYGWTVYSQELWSQTYRKLVALQRDERQLTTTSEMLKDKLAKEAEKPATRLVPASPASAIFLQPAPQLSSHAASPVSPDANSSAQNRQTITTPLGY